MKVLNVHERELHATPEQVGALIDSLASGADALWPKHSWPPMQFDRPLGVGARGGHGPIRYFIEEYVPGKSVKFRFTGPKGFDGFHGYDRVQTAANTVALRHTLKMATHGLAILSWPVIYRPMHDALIEDSFATAEASLGLAPRIQPWSPRVRFLRWVVSRGKARPQVTPNQHVQGAPASRALRRKMQLLSTISASIDATYSFLPHLKGRTHYHRIGPDDGPVVIMVSGATLPMAVWEPVVAPLVDSGFQIVRYDLPGRGHTPAEGLGASFQAHLDQLHCLLEGLDIHEPVRLVGLASGALIVAAYTERNRARVSHACLIAPDGASTRFTFTERLLAAPLLGTVLFRFTAQRTLLARVPRYSSRLDVQSFVRGLLDFSLRSPGFHQAVLATVRTFPLHRGEEQYLRLAKSGVPTVVVWGREDRITPSDAAGAMGAMFGEDSLRILENVGHLPFVEDPASVASLLERHFQHGR